jgi:hypothetical protein
MVGEVTVTEDPASQLADGALGAFASGDSRFPKLLAPPAKRGAVNIVPIYPKGKLAFSLAEREPRRAPLVPRVEIRDKRMSTWFSDETCPLLREEARQIAWNFLERSGEIDDPAEASEFLINKIEFMIGQGQRNRLMLSNRAIAAFLAYKKARTIELALISR